MIHQQFRRPCLQPSSMASKMLPSSSSASPTSDHAAFRLVRPPSMRAHIVLHEGREQCLRDAKADRTGGEINVVGVLAARGIALCTLVAAKQLELLQRLPSEQVLNGVKDRTGVRLDGHTVLRAKRLEIKRRHDGCE